MRHSPPLTWLLILSGACEEPEARQHWDNGAGLGHLFSLPPSPPPTKNSDLSFVLLEFLPPSDQLSDLEKCRLLGD